MKRTLARWTEKARVPELKMTPMIDVIFLLLVFFVLTANFNEIEMFLRMNLAAPGKNAAVQPEAPKGETVHIRAADGADGRLAWSVGEVVCAGREDVAAALAPLGSREVTAVIHPTDASSVEEVLDIYGLCRQAGLKRVQFAAKKGRSPARNQNLPKSE